MNRPTAYYKEYGFWCCISFIVTFLFLSAIFYCLYHKLYSSLAYIVPVFCTSFYGSHKIYDSKDKKNTLVFENRRKYFDDLRDVIVKMFRVSEQDNDFELNKNSLTKEISVLYNRAEQYFGRKSYLFTFIEQVKNLVIDYLYGVGKHSETTLGKKNIAAGELLCTFLDAKFINMRRDFELNTFKPERFDREWGELFNSLLQERQTTAKAVS